MYSEYKMSLDYIAGIIGCNKSTIRDYLLKYNINTRNKSEAGKLRQPATEDNLLKRSLSMKKHDRFGSSNPNWLGGKIEHKDYIYIKELNHPYCSKEGYVAEHRLVMEKKLGRYLKPEEVVHHINNIPNDNRIENLMLFKNSGNHTKFHWNSRKG
jgi:hypothetical protein